MTTFQFKGANDEAKAVMDLIGISYQEVQDGINVAFPEIVVISSDQDEYSQPSYYVYQVGAEKFVYPLDTEVLVIE